jgi:hypothetical protein
MRDRRTTRPIRTTARFIHFAGLLFAVAASLAAPPEKPMLRIISPVNGAVVRPGGKLTVKVAGRGEYSSMSVIGEARLGEPWFFRSLVPPVLGEPLARPWEAVLDFPLKMHPGLYSLKASGTAISGGEVESEKINIDLEPPEIPPVTFSQPALRIPVGGCVTVREGSPHTCEQTLSVFGTYPDGTRVSLNESAKIHCVSQAPTIVLSKDGVLVGVSAGTTRIIVLGKYTVDVTVLDPRR